MNQKLTAEVASLKAELATQKALVAELLKRLYGPKSEQMDTNQLLLTFLEDEAKKPVATAPAEDLGAVVEPEAKPARARRTNKLSDSLKSLPTIERIVTASEVIAAPEQYRLIGEEVSERLHIHPQSFTREIIRRQTHVKRGDLDGAPITPPLEPCLLPGSVLSPSPICLPKSFATTNPSTAWSGDCAPPTALSCAEISCVRGTTILPR